MVTPTFVSIWALAFLLFSLFPIVSAQSLNGICTGGQLYQFYTDTNNITYIAYCNANSNPGASGSTSQPNLTACIASCDTIAGCVSTTYSNTSTTCYWRNNFYYYVPGYSGYVTTQVYNAPPNYPAPVANYVNSSSGCGTPVASGINPGQTSTFYNFTDSTGQLRSYLLYVPLLYNISRASPIIFGYHGRGEQGGNFEGYSGFDNATWNPYAIMVYMNAINPDNSSPEWMSDPDVYNQTLYGLNYGHDLNFTNDLLANLSSSYCIDTGRVFMTGFSNGAGFTNVAACDPNLSTKFNAFAPHSTVDYTTTLDSACTGNVPYTVLTNNLVENHCANARSNPLIEIHGDNDGTASYTGGGRRGFCLPAIPNFVTSWAGYNGLNTTNYTTTPYYNVTKAVWVYGSGNAGYVTALRLTYWTHAWAAVADNPPAPIDATPQIMNFFYRFTNPNGSTLNYLSNYTSTYRIGVAPSTSSTATSTATVISSSSSTSVSSTNATATSYANTTTASTSTGSIATLTSSTSSSTATSTAGCIVAPSCPTANGTNYTTTQGFQYQIGCGLSYSVNAHTIIYGVYNFAGCFDYCDANSTCVAFTWNGANCYEIRFMGTFQWTSGTSGVVAAQMLPARASQNVSTPATTSSINFCPVTTYTTTTTTATSSATVVTSSSLSSSLSSSGVSNSSMSISMASTASSTASSLSSSSSATLTNSSLSTTSTSSSVASSLSSTSLSSSLSSNASSTLLSSTSSLSSSVSAALNNTTSSSSMSSSSSSSISAATSTSSTGVSSSSSTTRSSSSVSGSSSAFTSSSSGATSSPSTSSTTVATMSTSSSASSTSSITVVSATSYSCPANNGQTVADSYGGVYTIGCGNDTSGGGIYAGQATTSWMDCFYFCDSTSGCMAFTYTGATNGSGAGSCYNKLDSGETFVAGGTGYVAAIRTAAAVGFSTTSTSVSSTASTSVSSSAVSATTSSSLATVSSTLSSSSATTASSSTGSSSRSTSSTSTGSTASASTSSSGSSAGTSSSVTSTSSRSSSSTTAASSSVVAAASSSSSMMGSSSSSSAVASSSSAALASSSSSVVASSSSAVAASSSSAIAASSSSVAASSSSSFAASSSSSSAASASSSIAASSSSVIAASSSSAIAASSSSVVAAASSSSAAMSSSLASAASSSASAQANAAITTSSVSYPFNTVTGSYIASSTSTVISGTAAPACPSPTCPAINNVTCTDSSGKAYTNECDMGVTSGTTIEPTNNSTDSSSRKRQYEFYESSFLACQAECDETMGCMGLTWSNVTSECIMFAAITGMAYSPGTLFARRSPANDRIATTSAGFATTTALATAVAGSSTAVGASSSAVSIVYSPSSSGAGSGGSINTSPNTASSASSFPFMTTTGSASGSGTAAPRSGTAGTSPLTVTVRPSTCAVPKTYTTTIFTTGTITSCPSGASMGTMCMA